MQYQNMTDVIQGKTRMNIKSKEECRNRHGRDRMVVGFTTTYAISAYHYRNCELESRSGEVYSMKHYVIKFVDDLRQVGGFLQLL